MYSTEPVWFSPEDIIKKNEDFCFSNKITEKTIIRLLDSFLLRGRYIRHNRKVVILLESFQQLQNHIRYTLFKQGSKSEAKSNRPDYLKYKYRIPYDSSKSWYTPTELLDTYNFLKYDPIYNTRFIGELAQISLIVGKYSISESCFHILLPSFVEMLKYRDFSVQQLKVLPPPEDLNDG